MKDQVGAENIEALEASFIDRALERLSQCNNIEILGGKQAERVSILSFQIRCAGRYLHHGFVVALLNDLFGIQVRGGCSCAGPYGHYLLDIGDDESEEYLAALKRGEAILKPGWVRLNFNYFIDEASFNYLLTAIELLAKHAWKMLPYYAFDTNNSVWVYKNYQPKQPLNIDAIWQDEKIVNRELSEPSSVDFDAYLSAAEALLCDPPSAGIAGFSSLSTRGEALRWFVTAEELSGSCKSEAT